MSGRVAPPDLPVAVVGGGVAGLVAAHRLRAAGVRALVLEASTRVGGRLRAITLDGASFEPALHALPRSAPELGALVAELGLAKSVRREPLESIQRLRRRRLVSERARSLDHVARGPLRPLRARRLRDLLEWLGETPERAGGNAATRLDDRSVADFASVVLGSRVCPELYAPLLATHFAQDAHEASRQLLFSLLNPWGEAELSLGFGLSAVPDALAARLEPRTGERVVGVLDGGAAVRLSSGGELRTSAVVLAVPAAQAAELASDLSPAERQALAGQGYSDVLHLAVSTDIDVVEAAGRAVWIPQTEGGPLGGVIRLEAPPRALLLLVARLDFAARQHDLGDKELADALLAAAGPMLPGLRERVRERRLLRLPALLPRFAPGRYRAAELLRAERSRQPERRIFLAGDYLVGPHVEGAAVSGARAAAELRARFEPQ